VTTAKYYIPSGRCVQALDFSHPNADGSVGIIPDSLISEFKTRNGRIVKNGGGITPDVPMLPESLSQVASELYLRYFIFDFATKYYWAHPDIKTPSQFALSDQDYADFRDFLIAKKFDYKTVTEQSLNELISNAKKEKYYALHKDLFNEIEKDITHSLDQDLSIFKPEIKELLEEEIIGRYFYDEGAIAWTIKKDSLINKAIEILNNKDKYSSILNGSSGPQLITQKDTPASNKKKLQNKGVFTASI
jgi:carboxyl-terminal processing protease